MKIKNRKDVKTIEDACEKLQEMYNSKNLSVSYATITNKARLHKHIKTEEVYYVVGGKGKLNIGGKLFDIKAGDIIPIPKNTYHGVEVVEMPVDIVVVTHPRFDKNDLIY